MHCLPHSRVPHSETPPSHDPLTKGARHHSPRSRPLTEGLPRRDHPRDEQQPRNAEPGAAGALCPRAQQGGRDVLRDPRPRRQRPRRVAHVQRARWRRGPGRCRRGVELRGHVTPRLLLPRPVWIETVSSKVWASGCGRSGRSGRVRLGQVRSFATGLLLEFFYRRRLSTGSVQASYYTTNMRCTYALTVRKMASPPNNRVPDIKKSHQTPDKKSRKRQTR